MFCGARWVITRAISFPVIFLSSDSLEQGARREARFGIATLLGGHLLDNGPPFRCLGL
jgi:hypothetical protein